MSNIGKEYESRIMLSNEQYFNIVSFFLNKRINHPFIQNINIYYDDENLSLKNNHFTLRVRIINDAYSELTLKEKTPYGDLEYNDQINQKDIDLINKGIFPNGAVKQRLLALPYPLSSYREIARLFNRRLEIKEENYLLVIDKNEYGEITDYNLEVESSVSVEHANEILEKYTKQFNLIKSKDRYVGKAHRAIDEAIKRRL